GLQPVGPRRRGRGDRPPRIQGQRDELRRRRTGHRDRRREGVAVAGRLRRGLHPSRPMRGDRPWRSSHGHLDAAVAVILVLSAALGARSLAGRPPLGALVAVILAGTPVVLAVVLLSSSGGRPPRGLRRRPTLSWSDRPF